MKKSSLVLIFITLAAIFTVVLAIDKPDDIAEFALDRFEDERDRLTNCDFLYDYRGWYILKRELSNSIEYIVVGNIVVLGTNCKKVIPLKNRFYPSTCRIRVSTSKYDGHFFYGGYECRQGLSKLYPPPPLPPNYGTYYSSPSPSYGLAFSSGIFPDPPYGPTAFDFGFFLSDPVALDRYTSSRTMRIDNPLSTASSVRITPCSSTDYSAAAPTSTTTTTPKPPPAPPVPPPSPPLTSEPVVPSPIPTPSLPPLPPLPLLSPSPSIPVIPISINL